MSVINIIPVINFSSALTQLGTVAEDLALRIKAAFNRNRENRVQSNLIAKTKLCHGTTFSTLYQMSKQQGEDAHCMIPFGELAQKKIPVFAGECFRGIMDNGVNQKYTSWVLAKRADIAILYSHKFPFNPDAIYKILRNIITETLASDPKNGFGLPYANITSTAYWNQIILQIRQIRAWDEEKFQKEFKIGLTEWIGREISYFASRKKLFQDDVWSATMEKMKCVKQELQEPPVYKLSAADKAAISKTYPIVLVANSEMIFSDCRHDEILVEQRVKLGRDIQIIATEPSAIPEVEAYLRQQHLARRVSVISLQKLQELSDTIAKTDDR